MIYSKEEKGRWLEEWKGSGKSAWSFAKEKGLQGQTFLKWVKHERESKNGFVEIQTKTKSVTQLAGIIIEKGDIKVHIPLGVSKSEISTVIEGLQAVL